MWLGFHDAVDGLGFHDALHIDRHKRSVGILRRLQGRCFFFYDVVIITVRDGSGTTGKSVSSVRCHEQTHGKETFAVSRYGQPTAKLEDTAQLTTAHGEPAAHGRLRQRLTAKQATR
jgi:hypothetical protein